MNNQIKESDWKIFKELRPLALQRYCERVMEDVDRIVNMKDDNAYERYIEMFKIVREGDKKMARMFDRFSRSKALDQLVMYYDYGLLDDEEISKLSNETCERVHAILKPWNEL